MRCVYKKLLALLLAAALLGGCAARTAVPAVPLGAPSMPGVTDPWGGWHLPWNDGQSGRGEWGEDRGGYGADDSPTEAQRAYGSAALLGWPSVLVSLYLDEAGGPAWDDESIARSRGYLKTAIDWIAEQCAARDVRADIHYDDGTPDSGLCVRATFGGHFVGGEEMDESDDFYTFVEELCREIDTPALTGRYGTSSIGFLVFLPLAGSPFSIVHYFGEGAAFYYEYSCLYQYDSGFHREQWNNPATYAHEILHLYGAPDLYEGSTDPYVDDALVAYVERGWPRSIMNYTYEANGRPRYDGIDKVLDPLTAYRLGLCAAWEGQERFPDTAAAPPGTFTEDNTPLEWTDGAVAL